MCKIHTYLIFKAYLWEILGGEIDGKIQVSLAKSYF